MLINYIEFCAMKRIGLIGLVLLVASAAWSQVRVDKLVIKSGESFEFGNETDILVADTLVMMDSSRLVLNQLKRENFIRAKVAIIGNNCYIMGNGIHGKAGRDGRAGVTQVGPCRDGSDGSHGVSGLSGGPGVNLYFYVENLVVEGRLVIDLSGGNGGDGGAGGKGGDGSPGTVHCNGGDGANGGNGGRGGDGGHGGNLVISSVNADIIRNWIGTKVLFRNYGGKAGQGGRGGYIGSAGLGPSRRNGIDGKPGEYGANGVRGTEGTLTFEMNQ
jgi:hypothetical protein